MNSDKQQGSSTAAGDVAPPVGLRGLAAAYGVSDLTARKWLERGLPHTRSEGDPLTRATIDLATAEAWLEANQLGPHRRTSEVATGAAAMTPGEYAGAVSLRMLGRARWVQERGAWYRADGAGYWSRERMEGCLRDALAVAYAPGPDGAPALPEITEPQARTAIALCRGDEGLLATVDDFDADPWLLGCADAAIDLRTGRTMERPIPKGMLLRGERHDSEVDPAWLLTRAAAVPWQPKATAPGWEANCLRLCDGDPELARYLQMAVGMALVGDGVAKDHGFIYLLGPAGNGKSAFLRVLCRVLGNHAVLLNPRDFTERDRHLSWMIPLRGARLAVVLDMPAARLDTGKLRDLCGGDSLTANEMRGADETWAPTHTLIAAANNPPAFGRNTQGMERRYRPIQTGEALGRMMSGTFERDLVEQEGPGILAWAVAGNRAWQEAGCRLPQLARMEEQRAGHVRDASPATEWAGLWVLQEPGAFLTRAEARRSYAEWRLDQHMGAPRDPDFIELFNELRGEEGAEEGRRGAEGRGWWGLRLVQPDVAPR